MSELQNELRLSSQLDNLVRRHRMIALSGATLKFGMWVGGALLAYTLFDYFVSIDYLYRQFLSYSLYTFLAVSFFFVWLKPLIQGMNSESMAWHLEERYPEFKESLISALHFHKNPAQGQSAQMQEKVIDDAEAQLHQFHPLVVFRLAKSLMLSALMAFLSFSAIYLFTYPDSGLLLKRVLNPEPYDARPGSFALEQISPLTDTYIEGEPIVFKVRASGRQPEQVDLLLRQNAERRLNLTWNDVESVFKTTLEGSVGDIAFNFQSENVISPEKVLKFLPKPKIEKFHITYTYPEYTQLPQKTVESRSGDLQALVGTQVDIKAIASKKIIEQTLTWLDQSETKTYEAPGQMDMPFQKTIQEKGLYSIQFKDHDLIESDVELNYNIIAIPDQAPLITWLAQDVEQYKISHAKIDLKWLCEDDYGIVSQTLTLVRDHKPLAKIELSPEARETQYDLSQLDLKDGDQIQVNLLAKDAKQESLSETLLFNIVDDEDIQHALPFAQAAHKLAQEYRKLHRDTQAIQNAVDLIEELTPEQNQDDLSERRHQLGIQSLRLKNTQEALLEQLHGTEDLERMAFFDRAKKGLNLEKRYLHHIKSNLLLPLIDDPSKKEPLEKLILSSELNRNLLLALKNRAELYHDRYQLKRQSLTQSIEPEWLDEQKETYLKNLSYLKRLPETTYENGLNARYYLNWGYYPKTLSEQINETDLIKVVPQVDFNNTPDFGLKNDQKFAATFYGFLKVPVSGKIRFHLMSDDGSRMLLQNRTIIHNDGDHAMVEKEKTIELSKGFHFIELRYYNSAGPGGIKLSWTLPNQGKTIIPSKFLYTTLKDKEIDSFWIAQLQSTMESRMKNHGEIDAAIDAIQRELPSDPFNLNQAVAEIKDGQEESWEKVEQVKDHLKDLSERLEDEKLADMQAELAKALEEVEEDKDVNRLEELNELINESKKVTAENEVAISPEAKTRLEQLALDELDFLEKALALNDETEKSEQLQKAKQELQKDLIDSLEQDSKESIKGKLAALEAIQKAEENGLQSEDIAKAKELAQLEQDMSKNQLTQKEEEQAQKAFDEILDERLEEDQKQTLAQRESLQDIKDQTDQHKEQSDFLQKWGDHQSAKSLAEASQATQEDLQNLQQGQPAEPTVETDLAPEYERINDATLSSKISQVQDKLQEARQHQNKQKQTSQLVGQLKAQAQEKLQDISPKTLDHHQEETFQKAKDSMNKSAHTASEALKRLSERIKKDDAQKAKELKEVADQLGELTHDENHLQHEKNMEQNKLHELDHKARELQHELLKDSSELSQNIQEALQESRQAAREGRYDDAEKSLMAAQKDALEMASERQKGELNESQLAEQAMALLNEAQKRSHHDNKEQIESAKKDLQEKNYEEAQAKLEPLLEQKAKDLERFKTAEALAQKQKGLLPKLKEAERDLKNGKPEHAAMKLAAQLPESNLPSDLLQLQQAQQNLLHELEELKADEPNADLRKDLEKAIEDAKQGDMKDLHRELSRSKGEYDEQLKQAENLRKQEEQLAAQIDQLERKTETDLRQGKSQLKQSYEADKSKLRSQINKEKDPKQKQALQKELQQVTKMQNSTQHSDMKHVQNLLQHSLQGADYAEKAQEALELAQELKESGSSSDPEPALTLDPEQTQNLAEANEALTQASEPLAKGYANQDSSQNFEQASQALSETIASLDQQLLDGLPSAQAPSAVMAASSNDDQPSDQSDIQGDQFKLTPDENEVVPLSDNWAGLDGALKEQGGQGQENQYDDYFTQATHRYLQKIMKESRKWK